MLFRSLFGALTLTEYYTQAPVWGYYGLLWVLPLFLTFPLFMVLREWIQHGNADRGRYTNSRIFIVNPVLRYAVFPFGMDYHLPHHINASVPHYRLKDFHAYLMDRDKKYAAQALVVEGWKQDEDELSPPGIVDVLGPKYTPQGNKVHIDNDTLIEADVNDKAAIAAHVEASRADGTQDWAGNCTNAAVMNKPQFPTGDVRGAPEVRHQGARIRTGELENWDLKLVQRGRSPSAFGRIPSTQEGRGGGLHIGQYLFVASVRACG